MSQQKLTQLDRSIAGKVALITGAASGIGAATARLFVDEGASVGLVDINGEGLAELEQAITAVGGKVLCVTADCGEREPLCAAVEAIANHFGRLDIVVNNAGMALPADVNDADGIDASWERSMSVMATGQQRAIVTALPWLRKAPHPRIVNVASTEAFGATPYNSAYVAAKHASLGLTRALATELGKEGVTVNCVCPGPVHTGITAMFPDEQKTLFAKRRTALRRYAEPEEIAHGILHLVLPASSFITGVALPVDGGLLVRNA